MLTDRQLTSNKQNNTHNNPTCCSILPSLKRKILLVKKSSRMKIFSHDLNTVLLEITSRRWDRPTDIYHAISSIKETSSTIQNHPGGIKKMFFIENLIIHISNSYDFHDFMIKSTISLVTTYYLCVVSFWTSYHSHHVL